MLGKNKSEFEIEAEEKGKTDREIFLVSASWCVSCKAMKQWFLDMRILGIELRVLDIEEIKDTPISSVPALVFVDQGIEIQTLYGAMDKFSFINKVYSIWPDIKKLEVL
jgi:thiol:disulfide interchange protein